MLEKWLIEYFTVSMLRTLKTASCLVDNLFGSDDLVCQVSSFQPGHHDIQSNSGHDNIIIIMTFVLIDPGIGLDSDSDELKSCGTIINF